MITIYTQNTHSKITYEGDERKAKKLIVNSFIAKDKTLERDRRVLNGYMSPYVNFYNEDYDIIPTGLIPFLFEILDNNNIEYEHEELRKFASVNKDFVKKLINDELEFIDIEGDIRNPKDRPYQKESVLKVLKSRGGIINIPTAGGKCLHHDQILDLQVDDDLYNKLKELNFLEE